MPPLNDYRVCVRVFPPIRGIYVAGVEVERRSAPSEVYDLVFHSKDSSETREIVLGELRKRGIVVGENIEFWFQHLPTGK